MAPKKKEAGAKAKAKAKSSRARPNSAPSQLPDFPELAADKPADDEAADTQHKPGADGAAEESVVAANRENVDLFAETGDAEPQSDDDRPCLRGQLYSFRAGWNSLPEEVKDAYTKIKTEKKPGYTKDPNKMS